MTVDLTSNLGDWSGVYPQTKLTFVERPRCILCGGTNLRSLWTGQFSDQRVRAWLEAFHYEADLDKSLALERFHRVRCLGCAMTFHRFVLDDEGTRVLYQQWISRKQIEAFERSNGGTGSAAAFNRGVQVTKHLLRLQRLLAGEGGRRPITLLDFGSGDGQFVAAARLFGFDAHGVDFSPTRQGEANRGGVSLLDSLAAWDDGARGSLDVVTLFQVLEHVAEPLGLLRDLGRRLRQGGILIVEVPDCEGIPDAPRTWDEFHRVQPLEHPNHFTPATLRRFCGRAGFDFIPKPAAHVTTAALAVLKTEVARVIRPPSTSQYFVRRGD